MGYAGFQPTRVRHATSDRERGGMDSRARIFSEQPSPGCVGSYGYELQSSLASRPCVESSLVMNCIYIASNLTAFSTHTASMAPVHRQTVRFPHPPYTATIVPLNHPEYWAMDYFVYHVSKCDVCHPPYSHLCAVGISHAGSIDSYMYHNGRHIRSKTNSDVVLDIPYALRSVRELLNTMRYRFPVKVSRYRTQYYEPSRPRRNKSSHSYGKKRFMYF